jgi:hypothetical protein
MKATARWMKTSGHKLQQTKPPVEAWKMKGTRVSFPIK